MSNQFPIGAKVRTLVFAGPQLAEPGLVGVVAHHSGTLIGVDLGPGFSGNPLFGALSGPTGWYFSPDHLEPVDQPEVETNAWWRTT